MVAKSKKKFTNHQNKTDLPCSHMMDGYHVNRADVGPLLHRKDNLGNFDVDSHPGWSAHGGIAAPLPTTDHHLTYPPPVSHRGISHRQQQTVSGTGNALFKQVK